MKRSLQILMLIVIAFAGGVHLAAIQAVAWANMIIGDTEQYGLSVALERTFDGEHPCELCKLVESASSSASEDPVKDRENRNSLDIKLIPLEEVAIEIPSDARIPRVFVAWDRILIGREESPSVPPPRFV